MSKGNHMEAIDMDVCLCTCPGTGPPPVDYAVDFDVHVDFRQVCLVEALLLPIGFLDFIVFLGG